MKIKQLTTALIILLGSLTAAIPSGYYDTAAGKTGTDLRLALHNIIDGHTEITYDDIWDAFGTTDLKDNGKIWDMYTGIEFTYPDDQSTGSDVYTTYNREHSWPKSWANEDYPMYDDAFHLYPVQAYANSHRNNLPYGEVGSIVDYTSENGTKKGDARSGLGYVGTVFEPIDEYKGDLARTYFYISTRYYTEDSNWDSSGMTVKCEIRDWAMDMLLDWHHLDPVSQKELDRNEAVYAIQENRNPFIDHPDYADSIWTSSDTSSAPPPPEPTALSPGDIAITGVNMDNPDQISVVFLVDIEDGTEIKFTDNGWLSANDWRSNEGVFTWTASQAYSPGDEIIIDFTSGPSLATEGDQVIAYQNSSDMIAAINDEGSHVWQADATSSNTSALPQGLTNGTNCVALIETDNIQYDRSVTSGTKEELLAAINDYTNWTGNNTTPLTLSSSGFTISDTPLPVTLVSLKATVQNGSIKLAWETATETNNARFLIYRNDNIIGFVEGAGTSSQPHSYIFIDDAVVPGRTYTYVLADVDYANHVNKYEDNAVIVTLANDILEADFVVYKAYPNPFNPSVTINYQLSLANKVSASVYDMKGQLIEVLMDSDMPAGNHSLVWEASDISSGVYFLKMISGNIAKTQKLLLMR